MDLNNNVVVDRPHTINSNKFIYNNNNNNFHVFSEPLKAFTDVFSKLNKAKKSIYIETFELKKDFIGRELIEILIEKSKTIPVTLIVDDRGLGKLNKTIKKRIAASNMKFHIFNPWFIHIKHFRIKKLLSRILHINHRKLTIIDDKIAYVGGVNYNGKEINWRDIFVRIKGPILSQLILANKEMLKIISKKRNPRKNILRKYSQKNNAIDKVILQSPQIGKQNTLTKEIIRAIKNAKKEILITTPYFIPPLNLLIPLHKAIKRKVNVKIIIPKKSDGKMSSILTRHFAFLAFKEKINVFLYPKMTHAKYLIIDGKYCSFGSANLDYQTWFHNYELNISSKNEKLIKQLKTIWNKDIKISSKFNPKKDYLNRTKLYKIYEKILEKFKQRF